MASTKMIIYEKAWNLTQKQNEESKKKKTLIVGD